jgi:hypothetical protein
MTYYNSSKAKETRKKWRQRNHEKISAEAISNYRSNPKRYVYHMFKRAEKRAKEKNIPFTISKDDINIPHVCPILGIPLVIGQGKGPCDTSPSLDRIDPKLGYTPDNIMVISMKANKIKSDVLFEDIEKMYFYLKNKDHINT